MAGSARDVVGDHHALAWPEPRSVAGLGHLAHHLVPEDSGSRCGPAELRQVGAAEAAPQDSQQKLARAYPGGGPGLETDLAGRRMDGHPHEAR